MLAANCRRQGDLRQLALQGGLRRGDGRASAAVTTYWPGQLEVGGPEAVRRDALKILSADVSADQEYRQRFIREADLAAKLWHPNIVRINDRGEFNGQLWIAMDFVDGVDAQRLPAGRHPAGMRAHEVAPIVAAVASAYRRRPQRISATGTNGETANSG